MKANTVHVLSIEDNPSEALLIEEILNDATRLGWNLPSFQIKHVSRLSPALAHLDAKHIDVILTDLNLPDSHVADKTITQLLSHAPEIPLVILTGQADDNLARRAIQAGAEDYLLKREMSGSLLAHTLVHAIEQHAQKRALTAANNRLEERVQQRTIELTQAHENLRLEHNNLLSIFAAAPVGMLLINQETVIVEANERAATIVLRDPAEIVNQRVGNGLCCVNSLDDPRGCGYANACAACPLRRAVEQVLAGGEALHDIEISLELLINEQWEQRWFNVNANPVTLNSQRQLIVAVEDITERIRTMRALRESEARFHTIVDMLPQFVAYTDRELRYRFVNQTYQEKFGLTPDDVLGRTLPDVIGEAAFEKAHHHVERALSGERLHYHERYDYAIGGTRDIDGVLVPDVAEDGEVLGYYAVLTDITPYIETQEALHRSEARYRLLAENVEDMIWQMNATLDHYTYVSPSVSRLLGYTPEEMMALPFLSHLAPAYRPAVRQAVVRRLKAEQEGHGDDDMRLWEIQYVHKNGTLIWVESTTRPVRDDEGLFQGIVGVSRNIEARKQAEIALRESETALTSSEREKNLILNATSEMIAYYHTPDLEIQWANEAAAASLGLRPEEMINQRCYKLWHGRETPCERCPVLAAFETGSDHVEEITTPDGRIWSIRTYPIFDGANILGVVEFGLNITDRKQAEVALKESEQRYYTLFEHAPLMLWEEDFSEVCDYFKQLRASGINDVGNYFEQYPEELKACAGMIRVLAINQENVNFFELDSKNEIGDTLPYAFVEASWAVFREELAALARGETTFTSEIPLQTKHGKLKIARLQLSVMPGHEATLARVLISGVDITERQRLESELKTSLDEKEVLLREIHHRVKNNLMVVTSLIKMQAGQTTDPGAINLFRDIRNRVMAMAMVHEDLYQAENLAHIDFGAYLQRLTQSIQQSFASAAVALHVEAGNVILDVQQAIPCGLIVAELVTNALHHAFPDLPANDAGAESPPEIYVAMRRQETAYTLIVRDNGVGLPAEIDLQAPQTLGLRLVRSWVRHQLKGTLAVDTNSKGTMFTISFTV